MCSENMQQIYREYQCRSVILMKLQNSFIEIALRHGCSSVNLLHISRTPFYKSTSGRLFLHNQNFGRSRESLEGETLYSIPFNLRYFNPVRSFKLRWCRARDLSGSQIPVTTGGFERRIFCIWSSYLTHKSLWVSGLGNYFMRFVAQTLLWSLEFVIQIPFNPLVLVLQITRGLWCGV